MESELRTVHCAYNLVLMGEGGQITPFETLCGPYFQYPYRANEWRKLEFQVSPSQIQSRWQGGSVDRIRSEQVARMLVAPHAGLQMDLAQQGFGATGGLGVSLSGAVIEIRNVSITPTK